MKTLILGSILLVIGVVMYLLNYCDAENFFIILIGAVIFFRGAFLTINNLESNEKSKRN